MNSIYEKLNSNCSSHNVKNCSPPLGMRTVTLMMIQPRAYILAFGRDKNKIGMLIGPKPKHWGPKSDPNYLHLPSLAVWRRWSSFMMKANTNCHPTAIGLIVLSTFSTRYLICKCSSFEESIWVLIVSKPIIEYVTFWSNVIHISLVVSLNTKGCVGVRAILEIKGVCNRNRVSWDKFWGLEDLWRGCI